MPDVHDKVTRSYNMSRIRSTNTKPEMLVRRFLHANGFRYKIHDNKLPGKPDIVLPKYKTVILIHGCFWHGHANCKFAKFPKTNSSYWTPKIINNIAKDKKHIKSLKQDGWRIIVLWTCKLKSKTINKVFESLLKKIIL